jgi:mono/diheme cytochrome c family protein
MKSAVMSVAVLGVSAVLMAGGAGAADAPKSPAAAKPAPQAQAPAAKPAAAGGAAAVSIWDGVFSSAQAKRGDALYAKNCAQCHMPDMAGKEPAPELAGDNFLSKWYGHSVGELFTRIATTMPAGNPGNLTRANYADLVAVLLSANNFRSGKTDLVSSQPALDKIKIEPRPKKPAAGG